MGTFKELTDDEVTFTIDFVPEDLPVRGNAQESEDPDSDKEVEDEILARLNKGDYFAWCCVKVTAKWEDWSASDTIGAVSFGDNDNPEECDYIPDLKLGALHYLNEKVKSAKALLDKRVSTIMDTQA